MRITNPNSPRRRGAVTVLMALLIIFLLGMVAFSVDMGYTVLSREELQNAADSAALAGAGRLLDIELQANFNAQISTSLTNQAISNAKSEARLFAGKNTAGGSVYLTLPDSDITVGFMDLSSPSPTLTAAVPPLTFPNTVRVTTRRDSTVTTGSLQLFFAPVLGISNQDLQTTATASYQGRNVVGFNAPKSNQKSPLLPIGLDVQAWNALLNGTPLPPGYSTQDQYKYTAPQPNLKPPSNVTNSADGIPELVGIYPNSNAPGNFGLIDIGPDSNAAPSFWNWITNGPSAGDINYLAANHNGVSRSRSWQATPTNPATLKGGPGLKASDESYLQDIIGQPRIMPLFSSVSGNGSNTTYTIVGFAAVTIVEAQLTGGNKHITIQPVALSDPTVVIGSPSSGSTTKYIYRPLALVQ